jgi:protein tyrosine phosphatase (PTP) superfamily phosphohydrolase (DUF442 family)
MLASAQGGYVAQQVTASSAQSAASSAAPRTDTASLQADLAAARRVAGADIRKAATTVIDVGGEAIGLAEMVGLRYAVKSYSFRVSDKLMRGARVDGKQMAALQAEGVTGIVNLCAENNNDAPLAAQLKMDALHIPIIDNTVPTVQQVQQFLAFVAAHQTTYVHCEAGKGRTGTMTACYRMAAQGWSAADAVAEAKKFGMGIPRQWNFIQWYHDQVVAKTSAPPAPPPPGTPAA